MIVALLGDYFRDKGIDVKVIQRGEIWKVNDEYLSQGAKKHLFWEVKAKRPILVVFSDKHNDDFRNNKFIVVVPIAEHRTSSQDVLLEKGLGGITKECLAQITLFQGVPREAFLEKMGDLFSHQNIINEIEGRIVELLGITV